MKKTLFLFLMLLGVVFTDSAMAQNTCTIHLFSKGSPSKIYVNDQLVTGLNKDEALEYTLPANGRAVVSVRFNNDASAEVTVDTEKDSDAYIIAYVRAISNGSTISSSLIGLTKIVDIEKWNKKSKNFKDLVKLTAK
ncbi:MAG: hypothetical protein BGO87_09360 [Flavobacteriia bacterium 40-80]|nr:MAG: hypothetical protein BGO87_09360 [Flavobacteriia bacterium 40-80]